MQYNMGGSFCTPIVKQSLVLEMKINPDFSMMELCLRCEISDAGATGICWYGWQNERSTGALAYTMNID